MSSDESVERDFSPSLLPHPVFDFLTAQGAGYLPVDEHRSYLARFDRAAGEVVALLSYKPGSRFEVVNGSLWLHTEEFTFDKDDRPRGRREMSFFVEDFILHVQAHDATVGIFSEAVVLAVRDAVVSNEVHEVDEWLLVSGVRAFCPHGSSRYEPPAGLTDSVGAMRSRIAQLEARVAELESLTSPMDWHSCHYDRGHGNSTE